MHQQMPGSQLGPALQLPSWTRAGRLGAFVVTETGDIFVIPVPSVNTLQNSFPLQNTLYRITNAEGNLEEFLKLPVSTIPSQSNPYGLVGLTYDCDSQILYAASVSGSTRVSEKGSIFALSSRSAQVVARLDDIDILGLVVAKTARGKELLLGSARDARVLRVSLDRAGAFVGRPTLAFTFDEADELRARKLKFQGGELFVFATEFYYNLVALSEFKQPTFRLRYEAALDTWDLVEVTSPDIIDFPIEGTRYIRGDTP